MPFNRFDLPHCRAALAALLLPAAAALAAPPDDEEELALMFGDRDMVSIATGGALQLRRAPAVASVITARDIAAMGATDLDQVLASVAGVHVSNWSAPLNPLYYFRGIVGSYNPQVLMLVNGLPITSAFLGNRGQAWGGLALEHVARIEVIRGPGSALYGADAFAGVINVITKTAADIKGTEVGARIGSFRQRDAYIQYGGPLGPLTAALYLRAGRSDMGYGIVDKDVQSLLDGLFGTHASQAPGPVNAARETADARADLALGQWRLRLGAQDRKVGIGLGLADALDRTGIVPETRVYGDLSFQPKLEQSPWDLTLVLGAYEMRNRVGSPGYLLFPAGAFGGAYPQGVIGNPGHAEQHRHASITGLYNGFVQHKVRAGIGYRVQDLYGTFEQKNFNFTLVPGVGPALLPLGQLVDVRNDPNLLYLQPHKRHVHYAFVQDEWNLARDWTATLGVRHDRYSDFGGTTNPRVALVWDAGYNLIVKALAGRAFRAPNFTEQYSKNNPVNVGNPSVRPETLQMNELALAWQPSIYLQLDATLYKYWMRGIITATANADPTTGKTFQNTGDQTGTGMELEARWDASRNLRLSSHLSLQHSTDITTGLEAGLAPQRRWFGRAAFRFGDGWHAGTTVNHVAKRARQPGDARPAVADYTTADLTLRREEGHWSARVTRLNLFAADAREPTFAPGNVSNDIPLPGRALNVELSRRF